MNPWQWHQVLWVISLCGANLFAQDRLRLLHADVMNGRMEGNETLRELSGQVFFRQDSAEIRCDHAVQYVERSQVHLRGQVVILDPPKRLDAGEVWYFEKSGDYEAFGRPRLADSSRTLDADTLVYRQLPEHAFARGRVMLAEKKQSVWLQGERVDYWRQQGNALVMGAPVLTERDSAGVLLMTVTADTMEMFSDGARYQLSGHVHIRRDSIDAWCGRLTYRRDAERMHLAMQPSIHRQRDVMAAREIELVLTHNKVTMIELIKQSLVVSRVDTLQSAAELYDLMSGDRMQVQLDDQKVKQVTITGQATSYYHVYENKQAKGMNKALGDEIQLFFQNGEMFRIKIISDPGTSSGTFFPPDNAGSLQAELDERLQQARNPRSLDKKKQRDGKR